MPDPTTDAEAFLSEVDTTTAPGAMSPVEALAYIEAMQEHLGTELDARIEGLRADLKERA